jgi:hypothetical protein
MLRRLRNGGSQVYVNEGGQAVVDTLCRPPEERSGLNDGQGFPFLAPRGAPGLGRASSKSRPR